MLHATVTPPSRKFESRPLLFPFVSSNYVLLNITEQTATGITGTFTRPTRFHVRAQNSSIGWKLVVLIGGKAVTLNNPVELDPNPID